MAISYLVTQLRIFLSALAQPHLSALSFFSKFLLLSFFSYFFCCSDPMGSSAFQLFHLSGSRIVPPCFPMSGRRIFPLKPGPVLIFFLPRLPFSRSSCSFYLKFLTMSPRIHVGCRACEAGRKHEDPLGLSLSSQNFPALPPLPHEWRQPSAWMCSADFCSRTAFPSPFPHFCPPCPCVRRLII